MDGKSTNGTIDIIRRYDNQIAYWEREPNDGIYDAMNKVIGYATDDIIGIINSNDWYE